MTFLTRPLTLIAATVAGLVVAFVVDLGDLTGSASYRGLASLLLAVGLAAATRDIQFDHVRAHFGTVLTAVTLGVAAKAVIIAAVMVVVIREPFALVLGVAVAQIDPLSVAAIGGRRQISDRGRSILAIWASFDDPVTVLLTVYAAAVALDLSGVAGDASGSVAQLVDVARNLGINVLFAAVAYGLWWALERLRRRRAAWSTVLNAVAAVLLVGLVLVAAWQFLMLGIAVVGLFFRPRVRGLLPASVAVAFLSAAVMFGLVLKREVHLGYGIALGLAASLAQMLVSLPITRRLPSMDRAYLAAGQQNGITAVILALLLEPMFPGTVGIVAPAIVTIAVVYGISNALLDRYFAGPGAIRPPEPEPEPESTSVT